MTSYSIYYRTCGVKDKRTTVDTIKANTVDEAIEIFQTRHYRGTAIIAIFAN